MRGVILSEIHHHDDSLLRRRPSCCQQCHSRSVIPSVSLPQCIKLFVLPACPEHSDKIATSSSSSSSWFMLPPRLVQPINLSLSTLILHAKPTPGFWCSFHPSPPEMQPLQTAVTCHTPIVFINGVAANCTVQHRIIPSVSEYDLQR